MKNNLKQFRKEAGLTTQQLVDRCNRSQSGINHTEIRNKSPRLDTAYLIAKALDKSVYDIWPDNTKIETETITIRRVVIK